MARGAAPVPVDEGPPAVLPHPGEEAPDMPETQAQALRRRRAGNPVLEDQVQGMVTVQLVLAHRDHLGDGTHRLSLPWGEPSLAPPSR